MKRPAFWNTPAGVLIAANCARLTGTALLLTNHEGMVDEINLTCAALPKVERNKLLHHRFAPYLKHEVNELLAQAGLPPRYPSAETDDGRHPIV